MMSFNGAVAMFIVLKLNASEAVRSALINSFYDQFILTAFHTRVL